ncbi:MAG: hypothetical protein IH984_11940 [Planctomycetes bacterium]|nr:hypothetical protein [Planctomycetota bacterium]
MLGLIRYIVCYVNDLPRHRVKIFRIAPIPGGQWMLQVARNLIDGFDGYLLNKRFLLDDPGRWVTIYTIDL